MRIDIRTQLHNTRGRACRGQASDEGRDGGRPRRGLRDRLRLRRGSGVMEACLVLPILLAFSMGMVEFGYFFYCKHTIQAAARDGTRTAILGTATHSQAQTAVTNTMNSANFTNTSAYTIAFADPSTNTAIPNVATVAKGSGIKVTVSANYGNIGLRPLGVIPTSKPILGVTTMIKE